VGRNCSVSGIFIMLAVEIGGTGSRQKRDVGVRDDIEGETQYA
jgi:hypothetical protein